MKFLLLLTLISSLKSSRVVDCQEQFEECASIGCVHASAALLSRINAKINPCDDFYDFACGTFIKNTHTPDEKLIVNTESLLIDQLDENLFRLLNKPIEESEPRPHKLAKRLYGNCMDLEKLNASKQYEEIRKLLNLLGGWPLLNSNWTEANWSWERTLLNLRRIVGIGGGRNVFRNEVSDGLDEGEEESLQGISRSSEEGGSRDRTALEHEYPIFMYQIATALGAASTTDMKSELNEALELGKALNQLLNGRKFKPTSRVRAKEQRELKIELDCLRWMEIFDRFKLRSVKSSLVDYSKSVYDNLKDLKERFPKRTFANYVLWRVVDFATQFFDDDTLESVLKLFRETYGVVDREQRWKLCTRMTRKYAELASGSLYIKDYFPKESRDIALIMVRNIIEEFRRTIEASEWMDETTKAGAINIVDELSVFIGYDERLLDIANVNEYYGSGQRKDFTDNFIYLAMQLNAQQSDKMFKHRFRNETDWTIYARPTTSRASYNRKDNSIYFAAAFLQPPNFDINRPMSMNFGAIGAIIAHELTHCFDRFSQKINEWTEESTDKYVKRLKCIAQQYSSFVDPELDVNLNGTVTITEDVADNGGVKLAYRAYEEWARELNGKQQSQLIALKYTPQQLFWISYAQFYCSVQREEVKKLLLEAFEVHSFERFRVIGPLLNSAEFSRDFSCPIKSGMNREGERCAIW